MKNSYVSDLRQEFRGYNGAKFAKDLMAGVTVAAVALPLALAFGVSSGATAASGLLTAVICGFVISLLGGAYYQISGPTGAMAAVLLGSAIIVFMIVYPKKWNAVVPASLVSIILATAASLIIPMDIQRVGEIPSSLLLPERFTLEGLDLATVRGLLAPAVSIAALGMIESLLCGASAARMTGVRLNSDRELIAQGVGNILSPLFGGNCPYQCGHQIRRTDPAYGYDSCVGAAGVPAGAGTGYGTDSTQRLGRRPAGDGLAHERMAYHPVHLLP